MTLRSRKLPAGFWAGAGKTKAKTPARRRRAPRASKALTKVIKAVVRRDEEKKFCGLTVEYAIQHSPDISVADIKSVLPLQTQGAGYNQRIGDRIRPSSLVIDGAVSINDDGSGFVGVPITAVVFVLQAKRIRDPTQIASAPVNILLDNGTGATNWDGSTLNSFYPINKDEFEVLGARRMKLGDTTAENTRSMTARYHMKIRTPKVLNYNPGSSTVSNFAPFMVVGWCRDDGVLPAPSNLWVVHTASSRLTYTDA